MEEEEVKTEGRMKRFGRGTFNMAKSLVPWIVIVGAYVVFDNGVKAGINKLATGEWVTPINDEGDIIVENYYAKPDDLIKTKE
jgi:hypothetical protein